MNYLSFIWGILYTPVAAGVYVAMTALKILPEPRGMQSLAWSITVLILIGIPLYALLSKVTQTITWHSIGLFAIGTVVGILPAIIIMGVLVMALYGG